MSLVLTLPPDNLPPTVVVSPGSDTSVLVFTYKPDVTTQAPNDPGTGLLRWNTPEQLEATELYLDRLTADGFDAQLVMSKLQPGSGIWIQEEDLSTLYQEWTLDSYEARADWYILHVTLASVGGSGIMEPRAQPSTNRLAVIVLAKSGEAARLDALERRVALLEQR